MLLPFATTHYLTLVLPVLDSTSGNAFPPTISVLRCVESIFPRQFQSSLVFADGLRPIFPRSSSSPFSPRSPFHHLFGFSVHVHSGHMTQPRQLFGHICRMEVSKEESVKGWILHILLSVLYPDAEFTNEEIRKRMGSKRNIIRRIKERKLNLFGHICRI